MAASSNVTVCAVSSPLVHVTLSPALAFTDAGLNAKFLIVTAVTAPPPPPVEGAADAAAEGAAAGGAAVEAAVAAAVGAVVALVPEQAATARSAPAARTMN